MSVASTNRREGGPGIHLKQPGWAAAGATHAIGQAHARDGRLLRACDIALRLDATSDHDAWITEVAALNGSFAVVSRRDGHLLAAVDRLRSVPLFYTCGRDGAHIWDHTASEAVDWTLPLDPECLLEFQHVGYVTGQETLVPGFFQVRAGHAIYFDARQLSARQIRYYAYRHRNLLDAGDEALTLRLAAVHERVFQRLIEDVGERQIVIPLSGGYDSRLIGQSLRELGARNVLCYTYGLAGNWESAISCELARYLGFDWVMVPYSGDMWRGVAQSAAFDRYFMQAGNFASLAHIQDWPAVQALVAQDRVAQNAVFVPGHSGDFLAGSHVPRDFGRRERVARNELLQALFDTHYSLWDWPNATAAEMWRTFADRIERVVGDIADGTAEEAADVFECWDCEERQAKFIVNSVRCYESFGFEWRLPLFDSELMDFWSRIPLGGRMRRRLYLEYVRRYQRLPVSKPNTDRGTLLATAVRLLDAGGLRPFATQVRRRLKKHMWRRQYDCGDLGWFAMIDPEEFRSRYTGRENGHAFFLHRYLDALRARR
jgi:asparagine synthase (glutamine-hydrolysing)